MVLNVPGPEELTASFSHCAKNAIGATISVAFGAASTEIHD
jgi:hypothetical protein